jgi:hypothetical protein
MTGRTPPPQHLVAPALATQKQLDYIAGLAKERDIPEDARASLLARVESGEISKSKASDFIQRLLDKPKRTDRLPQRMGAPRDLMSEARGRFPVTFQLTEVDGGKTIELGFVHVGDTKVPQGKYALDTHDNDKFTNDVTFFNLFCFRPSPSETAYSLKMYVSDDLVKFGNNLQKEVLATIATDPAAASARYGEHKKRCGVCNRKLTKDESRDRGIGPVCFARMGW